MEKYLICQQIAVFFIMNKVICSSFLAERKGNSVEKKIRLTEQSDVNSFLW